MATVFWVGRHLSVSRRVFLVISNGHRAVQLALCISCVALISCSRPPRSRSLGQSGRSAVSSLIPTGLGSRVLSRLSALELNGEQRRQIASIQSDLQRSLVTLRASVSRAEIAIREEMAVSPPDIPLIQQKLESKHGLLIEMEMARIAAVHSIRPVLTEEQRAKFDDPTWQPCGPNDDRRTPRKEQRRPYGGGRNGGGPGRGPGGTGPPGRW